MRKRSKLFVAAAAVLLNAATPTIVIASATSPEAERNAIKSKLFSAPAMPHIDAAQEAYYSCAIPTSSNEAKFDNGMSPVFVNITATSSLMTIHFNGNVGINFYQDRQQIGFVRAYVNEDKPTDASDDITPQQVKVVDANAESLFRACVRLIYKGKAEIWKDRDTPVPQSPDNGLFDPLLNQPYHRPDTSHIWYNNDKQYKPELNAG